MQAQNIYLKETIEIIFHLIKKKERLLVLPKIQWATQGSEDLSVQKQQIENLKPHKFCFGKGYWTGNKILQFHPLFQKFSKVHQLSF